MKQDMYRQNIFRSAAAIIGLGWCLLAQVGCQNNSISALADNQVRISTKVNDNTALSADAAAAIPTDLSLTVDYGADYHTKKNVKWTNASGSWLADSPMEWKDSSPAPVYAYAPYIDNVTDPASVPFSVETDQSGGIEKSDFLGFASSPCPHPDNKVQIEFDHQLSKLTLNISYGNEFTPPYHAIKAVELLSCKVKFSYNPEIQAVTLDPHQTEIVMHPTGTTGQYEAIFPPQSFDGHTEMIAVKLDNNVEYYYFTPAAGHNFKKGTAYAMNLTVGHDQILIGSPVTVTDWTPSDKGGGQTVQVGDFLYQDGTTSHTYIKDPNNPCCAIVFFVGREKTDVTQYDFNPDNTMVHGYAVALKYTDPVNWMFEPLSYIGTNKSKTTVCGYSNTLKMKRAGLPIAKEVQQFSPVPKSTTTSGWYVPSVIEYVNLWQNKAIVQKSVTDAGGMTNIFFYALWSSTEIDAKNVNVYDGGTIRSWFKGQGWSYPTLPMLVF